MNLSFIHSKIPAYNSTTTPFISIPGYGLWHWGGLNDQFAIMSPRTAANYYTFIKSILDAHPNDYNMEAILKYHLEKSGDLPYIPLESFYNNIIRGSPEEFLAGHALFINGDFWKYALHRTATAEKMELGNSKEPSNFVSTFPAENSPE